MRIAYLGTLRFGYWCEDARQQPTVSLTGVVRIRSRRVDHHLDFEFRHIWPRGCGKYDRTEGGVRRSDFGHEKEKRDRKRAEARIEEEHDEISIRYGSIK